MNIEGYAAALLEIVREPSSNLTVAALLAASVVLILLIIILVLVMWAFGPTDDEEESLERAERLAGPDEETGPRRKPLITRYPWVTTLLMIALGIAAVVVAVDQTGTQQFCAESCHENVVAAGANEEHAQVECVSCHNDPVPQALISTLAFRIGHPFISDGDTADTVVTSNRCLACHEEIETGVRVVENRAIAVSHKEIIEGGLWCEECHTTGHVLRQTDQMSVCLRCHDGDTADSSCETCHIDDPATAVAERRVFNREVFLGPIEDCSGCHEQDTCDDCHGLRMPHSREFIEGDHAMSAAFERKEALCYRCHLDQDCGACHGSWDAHEPNFRETHKQMPRGLNCNSCHHGHRGSFCGRCHGEGW